MNTEKFISGQAKARNYPVSSFGGAPAYSIPNQHYPCRTSSSPSKSPHAREINTSSPSKVIEASQMRAGTISPLSDLGDITPGCTDYTPHREKFLKQEPGYAPQRADRFFKQSKKEGLANRPHVYEDPN